MENYIVMKSGGVYPQDAVGPIQAIDSDDAMREFVRMNFDRPTQPTEVNVVVFKEEDIASYDLVLSSSESLEIEIQ